ncbi:MAG: peptidoglycan DD-metalloendopeptidase family protein [Candidatus Ozemobacteraceae bacterium]
MNQIRTFALGVLGTLLLGFFWVGGLAALDMKAVLESTDPLKNACTPCPPGATATATEAATTDGFPMDGTVKVSSSLNVRTAPWGTIIGSLKGNAKIKITGILGDWYKIDYNGKTAYVHKNYVTTAKAAATGIAPTAPGGNSTSGGNSSNNGGSSSSSGSSNTVAPTPGKGRFGGSPASPMRPINSPYGMRMHPISHTRKMHNGVDVPLSGGTPLKSLGDGVVTFAGSAGGAGNMIVIKYDNGYESTYMHLQGFDVRQGARVSLGQQVGRVDSTGSSTGNHLHFEMKVNGGRVNPKSVSGLNW